MSGSFSVSTVASLSTAAPSLRSSLPTARVFDAKTTTTATTVVGDEEARISSQPIIDIGVVLDSKEKVPEGYYVVKKSITGSRADLNRGTSGRSLYLCYKRRALPPQPLPLERDPTRDDLSSAGTGSPGSPPTPIVSPHSTGSIALLNANANSNANNAHSNAADADAPDEQLAPITSLCVIFADLHEEPPYGFELISKTVSGTFSRHSFPH